MKKRLGFVSNSSSSSFIINLGDDDISNIEEYLDTNDEYAIDEIKSIMKELTLFDRNWIFRKELYGYFSEEDDKKQVCDDYSKLTPEDFYNKYKSKIDEFWNEFSINDKCYIGEFEDHYGVEQMVHNYDIQFVNVKSEKVISNH